MANKLVTFLTDIYPYCKGDVVRLDDDVLTQVDKVAKSRKVKQAYEDFQAAASHVEEDVQKDVKTAATAMKAKVAQVKDKTAAPADSATRVTPSATEPAADSDTNTNS